MSYVPFRDNPELARISDRDSGRILQLVDDLEEVARQSDHNHGSCYCDQGSQDYRKCVGGVRYPIVSSEEIVGLLMARGFLNMEAVREGD